jgi:hypothetical protein
LDTHSDSDIFEHTDSENSLIGDVNSLQKQYKEQERTIPQSSSDDDILPRAACENSLQIVQEQPDIQGRTISESENDNFWRERREERKIRRLSSSHTNHRR